MAAPTYGNITVDGGLTDWTTRDRLDIVPGTGVSGYEVYGKYAGNAYVLAIKSASSSSDPIGADTTVWLDTDQNANTGYQVFGFAGGAEYNVNFFTDSKPYLYTGAAGENYVTELLDYAYSNDGKTVELAIPVSLLNGSPQAVNLLIDVNNKVFLPGDYSLNKYTISANKILPERTDFSKQVGIVYSESTANQFFSKTAYSHLFMGMQYQATMAGIPFDVLTESDLTDINKIVNYDALIFPSFRNVPLSKVDAIENTLEDAVYKYGVSLITSGDFLSNDETGAVLPGDPYRRMKELLDVTRTGGGGPVNSTVKIHDYTNPVFQGYTSNEVIRNYNGTYYSTFGGVANQATVLADQVIDGQTYNAVLATTTGGKNVHFSSEALMGDNNLVWQALRWTVLDNKPSVGLNMSRNASIFISRNDMDQSMYVDEVSRVEVPLYNTLVEWKNNYNFVGSYYINVGNNPAQGEVTDWSVSGPLYRNYIALGNEIGTHSYTHPEDTNILTPAQLEFQFNQSQLVIEQQLGIDVLGAAIPGAPEGLSIGQELQKYLSYISGGYAGVGAGYPGAFGYQTPDSNMVYFAPNIAFDFSLIGFQKLTAQQAEAVWAQEYADVTRHTSQAIIHWPWHDYGPTSFEPGYTKEMFTNFIARAYNDNTEFVTLADLQQRIRSFEKAKLFESVNGDTITARVDSTDVGKFSLDVNSNQLIKSVNNWYAYDGTKVFLPKNGGDFTINLGATQDDVTHITALPMRSELLSLNGDGTNLEFSFVGDGKVALDLKALNGLKVVTEGADKTNLNGEILEMSFNTYGQHTGRIRFTTDSPPTVANAIADLNVNEDAPNTVISLANVFTDPDDDVSAIAKSIELNNNPNLVNARIDGNNLILAYQPDQFGTAQISIRATSNGKTVDDTFNITVNKVFNRIYG
ncbi:MAG TPA: polysaccharide deacetylase, partial [Cyanobacteria bacterium UBA11049]|nr:polysaccharide deacetylase [Cyanobacteria bacterium UBA11049]